MTKAQRSLTPAEGDRRRRLGIALSGFTGIAVGALVVWLLAIGSRGVDIATILALPAAVVGLAVMPALRASRRHLTSATAGVLLAGVVGLTVWPGAHALVGVPRPPHGGNAPSATILAPAGDTVSHRFELSGALTDPPEGTKIWATSRELDGRNPYYPAPTDCTATATAYDCHTFYVGLVDGTRYSLIIMAAPPDAVRELEADVKTVRETHGVDALPSDVTILAQKQVTLVCPPGGRCR